MIKFTCPDKLDGAILIQELQAAGIEVKADRFGVVAPFIDGNGDLFLDIAAKDQAKATEVLTTHKA
jgi:hypothetical protein